MADKAWKAAERQAAALFGGKRHWANAGERLDFESDTAVGQVKLVRVLSLEALTQLAEEMEREALPKQKIGVVCAKVRRGTGRKSPLLVVMTAAVWEAMCGKRTEQIAPAEIQWRATTVPVPITTRFMSPGDVKEALKRARNQPPPEPDGFHPLAARPDVGNEDPGYMAGRVLPNP